MPEEQRKHERNENSSDPEHRQTPEKQSEEEEDIHRKYERLRPPARAIPFNGYGPAFEDFVRRFRVALDRVSQAALPSLSRSNDKDAWLLFVAVP